MFEILEHLPYACLLYNFFKSLHKFYFWWHWTNKLPVTLQFMALPCNWLFNSWFDWQIPHSCGVWQWQVPFLFWLPNLRECFKSKHSCSYVIVVAWHNIRKRLLLSIFFYAEKALGSLTICTGSPESLSQYWNIMTCAGPNGYLCTVYKNSECCGEAAPATMSHLGNHQCIVPMRQKMLQVCCNKIPQ